jgi:membrane-bound lytic murein transglycosylase B
MGKISKNPGSTAGFLCGHGWQEGKDAFRDIAQERKEYLLAQNSPDWSKDPVYLCLHPPVHFLCNLV